MKAALITVALAIALVLQTALTGAAFPSEVAALMDTSTDPCDDFYQYACGGWIQNHTLPDDTQAYAYSFNGLGERNERVIREIIQDDWPHIGELYDSCMALDDLTEMGCKPLHEDLARINGAATKTELARLAGRLAVVGASLFTDVSVAAHVNDTSRKVLYVGYADMVLPDPRFYTNSAAFTSIERAFRTYISTIMALACVDLFGDSSETSAADDDSNIEDVVIMIEKKLVTILPTKQESSGYTSLTYSEATERYPLTFQAMTEGLQVLERSSLLADSSVLFVTLGFMDRAERLFESLELTDLKIYYSFLYVNAFAQYLGEDFVEAYFEFFGKTLGNQPTRAKRESVCSTALTTFFPDLIGKYYFLKMFDVERERDVQFMVSSIKQAMGDRIASLTWLDDVTREEASAKLAKLTSLVGRSTEKVNYTFVLTRDNYLQNVQTIKKHAWNNVLAKIDKPIDRTEWIMSAASVNAYYSAQANQIVLPAGILQSPFYAGNVHPTQNFGAIGAVIGHEITHGFDPSGRHFDGDGNQREWWTEATAREFDQRARCFQDQYSDMLVFGDTGKPLGYINGNRTVAENIADNGGVSIALDAYRTWIKGGATVDSSGVDEAEVEQLFFVSFAQVWCSQIRDGAQKKLLTTDSHASKSARVNGVAMNSQQFAETFQCRTGSKMNPEKKCQLW